MSHVSKYKHKIKDISTFKKTLDSLKIPYKENCVVDLYGSNKVKAKLSFKLEGWRYSCAVTEEGDIMYDHFGSQSNTMEKLGLTIKDYNKRAIMNKALMFSTNFWEEDLQKATKLVLEF